MKKHAWIRNSVTTLLTGFKGVCMDCGEARTGSLRGGTCPGYKKPAAKGE